jgi:diguanylate cyclase (GGDEF)-like protein
MKTRLDDTQVFVITKDRAFLAAVRDVVHSALGTPNAFRPAFHMQDLPPTVGLRDLLVMDVRCCSATDPVLPKLPCAKLVLSGPGPAALGELRSALEKLRPPWLRGANPASHRHRTSPDGDPTSPPPPALRLSPAQREQYLLSLACHLATLKPEKIVEACREILPPLVEARRCSGYFFNPARERLELVWRVPDEPLAEHVAVSPFRTDSPMAVAVNRRCTWHARNVDRELTAMGLSLDRPHTCRYQSNSCIVAPVVYGAELLGVLNFADPVDGPCFDWAELESLVEGITHLLAASLQSVSTIEALEQMARTDGLTGLANYRAFEETVAREVVRAKRYNLPLSLVLMDVDQLKLVNDRHGHQAGDLLLREVARRIKGAIRETDIAARQGGDEFSVILPNTPLPAARHVADRIEEAMNGAQVRWLEHVFQSSVSMAFAQYDGRSSVRDFVAEVDAHLYRRKSDAQLALHNI